MVEKIPFTGANPRPNVSEGYEVTSELPATMCVCVCVFFLIILDIKFVGRTSRGYAGGMSHRIFHPSSFCGA